MSLHELRVALAPTGESLLPFAAIDRRAPRRARAPLVIHFDLPYRQWDGPRLSWAEDFGKGKGQVYARDGGEPERSCNEVEVAKRLRTIREQAFWFSSYSPRQSPSLWRPWARAPEEAPAWLRDVDARIRLTISSSLGGIPDVIAWNGQGSLSSALFVECKGPKETFKEAQEDWITTALA